MAVITLQVDTSAAKSALNGVNQAITQIKINGASVTIGGKQISKQLNQISTGAQEAGKNINKATTKATNDAIKGIKATTSQFKQGVGIIKTLANGVVSWWTAIIIGIEMATKAGTYFFTNLTESIPKLNQKMDNLNDQVKKTYENWQKEKKVTDQYNTSLKELSEKQKLTNTQQIVAQALIDKLNLKYKGLNLTIDETTKKVKGYSDAVKQMNKQDLEQQQKLLSQQISAKKQQVDARLAQTFGTDKVTLAQADADKMFTNAENWFGDISSLARQQMSLKWNNGNLNDKLQILKDLSTTHSNNEEIQKTINGAITALEELIRLQKDYNDLVDVTNIRLANGQELLQQQKEVQQRIIDLNNNTEETLQSIVNDQEQVWFDSLQTEEQKIQFLQGKLKKLQSEQRAAQAQIDRLESSDPELSAIKGVSDSLEGQIKDMGGEITDLTDKITKLKREFEKKTGNPLRTNVRQIQQQIRDAQSIINNKRQNNNGIIGALIDTGVIQHAQGQLQDSSYQLKIAKQVLDLQSKVTQKNNDRKTLTIALRQNEQKYNEAVKDSLIDEQALATAKNKQAKLQKQMYDNTKKQQSLQKSLSDKAIKAAEADDEAKRKAAEAEADLAAKRQEASRNFFQSNKYNQVQEYLRLIGKQREALILEQKINLARAMGLKSIKELNEAQTRGIERQVDMQMKLDQLSKMSGIDMDRPNIISNELARKGGFASSVVVERNNVNKQILSAAQQQVNLQNAIKNEISKYGVIS